MTVSIRDQLMARTDPTAPSATTSARVSRLAAPTDLLGAAPRRDVAFLSPAARALSSPEAARIDGFPPPPDSDAPRAIDVRA